MRKQKPKKVMKISEYYRQENAPEGTDPNILEILLGNKYEPKAKEALELLLTDPASMTTEETATIIVYLELQRLRVPRQAEWAEDLLRAFALQNFSPDVANALLRGEIKITKQYRLEFMQMLTGELSKYLQCMNWRLVNAEEGATFITSDNLVVFFNRDFLPPNEAGLGLVGTTVFFPIDLTHLLVLNYPKYLSGDYKTASDKVELPPKGDRTIKVLRVSWDKAAVDRNNWLMTQLSHRFIAGCNEDILKSAVEYQGNFKIDG